MSFLESVFFANIPANTVWATPQPGDRANSSLLWFVCWIRPFPEMTHFHSYATGMSRMHSGNVRTVHCVNSRFLIHLRSYRLWLDPQSGMFWESRRNQEGFAKEAKENVGITGFFKDFFSQAPGAEKKSSSPKGEVATPSGIDHHGMMDCIPDTTWNPKQFNYKL